MSKFKEFYEKEESYFGTKPSDGLVAAIEKYGITGDTALDIGAGEGRNSFYLDELGFKVTAIEPESSGVRKLRKNERIEVKQTGFTEYNEDSKFDFILAGTSLDQLPEEEIAPAVNKLVNLLNEGGHAYILSFTEDDPQASECADTVGHYFKKGELEGLLNRKDVEMLYYKEYMKIDESHGPVHYHGKVKAIIKKVDK